MEQAQRAHNDADAWHLPIGHRAEDSLDTEGLTIASVEAAIPEDNKGFQMLQKLGWKGNGLGKHETGNPFLMALMHHAYVCIEFA